jgi:hypothetical protein
MIMPDLNKIEYFGIEIKPIEYAGNSRQIGREFQIRLVVNGKKFTRSEILLFNDMSSILDQLFELSKIELERMVMDASKAEMTRPG